MSHQLLDLLEDTLAQVLYERVLARLQEDVLGGRGHGRGLVEEGVEVEVPLARHHGRGRGRLFDRLFPRQLVGKVLDLHGGLP